MTGYTMLRNTAHGIIRARETDDKSFEIESWGIRTDRIVLRPREIPILLAALFDTQAVREELTPALLQMLWEQHAAPLEVRDEQHG